MSIGVFSDSLIFDKNKSAILCFFDMVRQKECEPCYFSNKKGSKKRYSLSSESIFFVHVIVKIAIRIRFVTCGSEIFTKEGGFFQRKLVPADEIHKLQLVLNLFGKSAENSISLAAVWAEISVLTSNAAFERYPLGQLSLKIGKSVV